MKRTWLIWLAFALCAAAVFAAMGWVCLTVIRLDQAETQARREAALEENVRLALWRMETVLAPLIAQESARPYFAYQPFYPAGRAYTRMYGRLTADEVLIPSPLLDEPVPFVWLHFQIDPDGQLASPQVPTGPMAKVATGRPNGSAHLKEAAQKLVELNQRVALTDLQRVVPTDWVLVEKSVPAPELACKLTGPAASRVATLPGNAPDSLNTNRAGGAASSPQDQRPVPQGAAPDRSSNPKTDYVSDQAQQKPGPSPEPAKKTDALPLSKQAQRSDQRQQALPQAVKQAANPAAASKAQQPITQTAAPNPPPAANQADKSTATPPAQRPATQAAMPNQQAVVQRENDYAQTQQMRNVQEWAARDLVNIDNNDAVVTMQPAPRRRSSISTKLEEGGGGEVRVGVLKPMWVSNELIMLRQVKAGGKTYLQGCWLDWSAIRHRLLDGIKDLLPAADLVPQLGQPDPSEGRTLAALPLKLVPGRLPAVLSVAAPSPRQFVLKLAGLSVLVAVLAVGLLLLGAVSLSQRRAAFVSSVTHELRTPLTTFRMYTEMLVEGMTSGYDQQRQYHRTLQQEADRLSHLVENVLAYARLERGRYGIREQVSLGTLMDRVVPRLAEHATQAGMDLVFEDDPALAGTAVSADMAAVERILFNLVDNAGKYAASALDRRVHLHMATRGRKVLISVRDHGPGIARGQMRRLFKPFRKSAQEAARSAPGVGIGLVLSRRLARAMGGQLRLLETSPQGTRFQLELPLVSAPKS